MGSKRSQKFTPIHVHDEVQGRFTEFAKGLGKTYTETLELLLGLVVPGDEDPMIAGRRMSMGGELRTKEDPPGNHAGHQVYPVAPFA